MRTDRIVAEKRKWTDHGMDDCDTTAEVKDGIRRLMSSEKLVREEAEDKEAEVGHRFACGVR